MGQPWRAEVAVQIKGVIVGGENHGEQKSSQNQLAKKTSENGGSQMGLTVGQYRCCFYHWLQIKSRYKVREGKTSAGTHRSCRIRSPLGESSQLWCLSAKQRSECTALLLRLSCLCVEVGDRKENSFGGNGIKYWIATNWKFKKCSRERFS